MGEYSYEITDETISLNVHKLCCIRKLTKKADKLGLFFFFGAAILSIGIFFVSPLFMIPTAIFLIISGAIYAGTNIINNIENFIGNNNNKDIIASEVKVPTNSKKLQKLKSFRNEIIEA